MSEPMVGPNTCGHCGGQYGEHKPDCAITTRLANSLEKYSERWETLADQLARSYVQINACCHCNHPVVKGFCCGTCGSHTP